MGGISGLPGNCLEFVLPPVLDPKELGTTFGYTTHQILEFPTFGHPIPFNFLWRGAARGTPKGIGVISVCQLGPPSRSLPPLPPPPWAWFLGHFVPPGHYSGRISGSRALLWERFGLPGIVPGPFRAPRALFWTSFGPPGHYSGSISCPQAFLALTQVQENQHCYAICPPIHR